MMRGRRLLCALIAAVVLLCAWASTVHAHEIRPAYLELREHAQNTFRVLFKVPMRGDRHLSIDPEFPEGTVVVVPVESRVSADALVRTWTIRTDGPLHGAALRLRGLETTMTDALVRIEFADGTSLARILQPSDPSLVVPQAKDLGALAATYLRFGVEHILLGTDHLLFVFGLLLIVRSGRILLATITSFTVAHSITLGAAALGAGAPPSAPLEAAIALSILFLGPEIVRARRGETTLTLRFPFAVAFVFGLIHGFGFAGAISEAGLAGAELPPALLFFNLGVEAGQIAFVLACLGIRATAARIPVAWPPWILRLPGFAVGTFGAYWTIERTVALLSAAP